MSEESAMPYGAPQVISSSGTSQIAVPLMSQADMATPLLENYYPEADPMLNPSDMPTAEELLLNTGDQAMKVAKTMDCKNWMYVAGALALILMIRGK